MRIDQKNEDIASLTKREKDDPGARQQCNLNGVITPEQTTNFDTFVSRM